jgi:DNA-binding response OmpR family regulator/S1-C subfamily serine protease
MSSDQPSDSTSPELNTESARTSAPANPSPASANVAREKIAVIDSDSSTRQSLAALLESAGYEVVVADPTRDGLRQAREAAPSLLLLSQRVQTAGGQPSGTTQTPSPREFIAEWKAAGQTANTPVILLVDASESRAQALDMGADDVLARPFISDELLARLRSQLRAKHVTDGLRERVRLAERGRETARAAVEALTTGEKIRGDASKIGRVLTRGAILIFIGAGLMATFFFLFNHTAKKQQQLANAFLGRVGQVGRQRGLMAEVHKLRASLTPGSAKILPPTISTPTDATDTSVPVTPAASAAAAQQGDLEKHADDLKAQIANANAQELRDLQKELAETNARLKKVESSRTAAEGVIGSDAPSVCLLHVSVAFRDKDSGKRLHYAGINPQGEPIQDSQGNPIFTLDDRGPELRMDVFGTGFLAGANGRIITNRHVAQPWWKDEDIAQLTNQGFQPEISTIRAYFPSDPHAFHAEIDKISDETDLATMRVDLQGAKRPTLAVVDSKDGAKSGESIVLMGYATGLAGILARADEDTAQQIISKNNGDVPAILAELAQRGLIRPLITQGHVGDVLPDKIVFDAQTTSGGSGGPLLNHDGKVIGVTYAVLRGFGGSNFGIPARFATSLLGQ